MSSKLEPVIWLRVLVTLAYIKGQTYVRTDVHDVMAIKPNFLTSMGYLIFLTMVLRARGAPLLITLPFKDQKSADSVRKQLNDLGKKIDRVIQPVFTSKKISEDLKVTETKPSLVNQQCVVYEYQCNSCDSNDIGYSLGYTSRHLHLRIDEHKYSVIGKHLKDKHNQRPTNLHEHFTILKKCHGKCECLIYEMLLIRKKRPTLNTQNDSIPANFTILLFIPASFIPKQFVTYYCIYNVHYLVIICI